MAMKYQISIIGGPKIKKVISVLVLFSTMVFAQQKGTFSDPRDNKTYKAVKIGSQIWMAENLNYAVSGSKCYNNDPGNCRKYGRLYNWDAAMRVCPYGWHLPSDYEWDVLMADVDGVELKAKSGWKSYYDGSSGNGTDKFGFSALPGGFGGSDGSFGGIGDFSNWWSASYYAGFIAYRPIVYYINVITSWLDFDKSDLFSVRCVRD